MSEEEFFAGHLAMLPVYERLRQELLWRYPDMEIRVSRTQVSFHDRHMFACVSFSRVLPKEVLPKPYLTLTLGLPEPLESLRVSVRAEPYPGRWTHHLAISGADELDEDLFCWIDAAHRFALMK